jgi:cytochrome P450
MAAYETSLTSLSAILYFLLRHPIQMRELQKEVRATFTSVESIPGQKLTTLPFLNGCIQESLRLLPPANGTMSRRISPGVVIDGLYVPAGVGCPPNHLSL